MSGADPGAELPEKSEQNGVGLLTVFQNMLAFLYFLLSLGFFFFLIFAQFLKYGLLHTTNI